MQLLLIVIPCTLVGIAVAAVLDRAGVLPNIDRPGNAPSRSGGSSSMLRPLSLGTIMILATWILAWLVVLGVGLNIILAAS